jgi:septation ring formation regulator EzrA
MQDIDLYKMNIYETHKFPLKINEAMILLCAVIAFSYFFTDKSTDLNKKHSDILEKIERMNETNKNILEKIEHMNERNKAIEEGLIVVISAVSTNNSCISMLGDTVQHLASNQERTTDIYSTLTGICTEINKKLRVNGIVLKRT